VNDEAIVPLLNSKYPKVLFKIENDAKCAALGEYYFGAHQGIDNYILVALGTGVGSGVVMNGKLFIGARGNGTEIGHIPTHTGKTLEEHVGLKNLVRYAKELLAADLKYKSSLHDAVEIDPKLIQDHAEKGDQIALEVYQHAGRVLGEAMVGVIRVLDLNNILLGGGISPAIELMKPSMLEVLNKHLPTYYTHDLQIKQASLSNDAGLLGAAALILEK
jgi:glucokinase